MILALNIGNSNITFGGYTPDGKLVFSSRLFADTALSSDELLYKIVNMLALYGAEPQQITAVIFSSVVPALTPRLREALRKMCECQIMEVGPGLKSGVRIRMDNPAQLGGELLCAIVGALLILPVSFMQAIWFVVFLIVLQQIEGNLIYPHVVGKSVGLPGIWVFFAVIVGSGLGGIAGMLLGVPVCAVIYDETRRAIRKRETADTSQKG